MKKLELTIEMSKNNVKDAYFAITLVVDKNNDLSIYNTKEDGDWRETVDCNTLVVREIKLRPHLTRVNSKINTKLISY